MSCGPFSLSILDDGVEDAVEMENYKIREGSKKQYQIGGNKQQNCTKNNGSGKKEDSRKEALGEHRPASSRCCSSP